MLSSYCFYFSISSLSFSLFRINFTSLTVSCFFSSCVMIVLLIIFKLPLYGLEYKSLMTPVVFWVLNAGTCVFYTTYFCTEHGYTSCTHQVCSGHDEWYTIEVCSDSNFFISLCFSPSLLFSLWGNVSGNGSYHQTCSVVWWLGTPASHVPNSGMQVSTLKTHYQ